jgi:hypothetical protein
MKNILQESLQLILRLGKTRVTWIGSAIRSTVLVLGTLVLLALLLEVFTRFLFPYPLFPPVFDYKPFTSQHILVNREGCGKAGTLTTNQWGFRGPVRFFSYGKFMPVFVVGNSATLCRNITDTLVWTYRLQTGLRSKGIRADIYNAGIGAITSASYVYLFDKYISQLYPKAVLFYMGTRDLDINLSGSRRNFGNVIDKNFVAKSIPTTLPQRLLAYSSLSRACYAAWRLLTGRVEVVDYRSAALSPQDSCRLTPSDSVPPDDSLLPWFKNYRENIQTLVTLCRRNSVTPIFVFAPAAYTCDSPAANTPSARFKFMERTIVLSSCKMALLYERLGSSLFEICKDNNVACIDLNSRIKSIPSCFIDETHFSEKGCAVIGYELCEFVAPLLKP